MVSQQRTIEAQLIASEQLPAAVSIIRQAIEPHAELVESAAEAAVRFRTACSEDHLGELLANLVRGGVRVTQFRELQTDLEEAYLSFSRPAELGDCGAPLRVALHDAERRATLVAAPSEDSNEHRAGGQ